jgi:hypothetical protein
VDFSFVPFLFPSVFLLANFHLALSQAKSAVTGLDEEVWVLFQYLLPHIQQGSEHHTHFDFSGMRRASRKVTGTGSGS